MTDLEILHRGTEEVLPEGTLEKRLAEGQPLRVKLGIDPTAPDIHLGHVVVLTKLAQFQEQGHQVVLIIGDYTARVGDPSGRDTQRPILTPGEIDANAKTFPDQAFKVLDRDATEVRFNSEWLDMPLDELFQLMGKVTVGRLLERDDFTNRMKADQPISSLELLYHILQGYDSVAIRSDVELGGTDQTFNLLFARDIQRAYDVPEQSIMTMPILPGIDGVRRMSKSLGNYVGVTDPPEEMFGRLMRVPDTAMPEYYRLLLGEEPSGDVPPIEAKRALARRIVERFHGPQAGPVAEQHFDRLFVERAAPDDVQEADLTPYMDSGDGNGEMVHLPRLMADLFEMSRSEARRLIQEGGVSLDGEALEGGRLDATAGELEGR